VDVMRLFNDDPETDAVIMVGEIGGTDEEDCARWIKDNMKKPVVGFIAGITTPPGKRMGHAGAIVRGMAGSVEGKHEALRSARVEVLESPIQVAQWAGKHNLK
jgi:succinyl-CoA synthetase alpha subunit